VFVGKDIHIALSGALIIGLFFVSLGYFSTHTDSNGALTGAVVGNSYTGDWQNAGWAVWSHEGQVRNPAILQSASGQVLLNSPSQVQVTIGLDPVLVVGAGSVVVTGNITAGAVAAGKVDAGQVCSGTVCLSGLRSDIDSLRQETGNSSKMLRQIGNLERRVSDMEQFLDTLGYQEWLAQKWR